MYVKKLHVLKLIEFRTAEITLKTSTTVIDAFSDVRNNQSLSKKELFGINPICPMSYSFLREDRKRTEIPRGVSLKLNPLVDGERQNGLL